MLDNPKPDFDVVIVGGGPAGLTAANWCIELGMSVKLVEAATELGGQLFNIKNSITNYPGVTASNGRHFRELLTREVNALSAIAKTRMKVSRVDAEGRNVLFRDGTKTSGKFLIIATGVRRRRLRIVGEEEFAGRGVLESGVLQAASTAGMTVAVVGGGEAALENALLFSGPSERVHLIHRGEVFKARQTFVDRVRKTRNIKVHCGTVIKQIHGDDHVEFVSIESLSSGVCSILPVDTVLVRIGVEPNSELIDTTIEVDERGYIIIDAECRTSASNVYAIGDIANPTAPTIAGAVGHGATAAKSIAAHFNENLGYHTRI